MNIVELIGVTHGVLAGAGIPHAFGGALALAYYADPRGTQDADVNVFVAFERAPEVVALFAPVGLAPEEPPDRWSRIGGVRLRPTSGSARLDLFLSLDQRYDEIADRIRWFPFGDDDIDLPFLSAHDLVVFKLSFGRDKDWVDLRRMAESGTQVDMALVEAVLIGLRGPSMYPRLARARTLFAGTVAGR